MMYAGLAVKAGRPREKTTQGEIAVASNIRFLNPDTLYKPPGYSHVVEMTGPGRTVYIAGQLGLDVDGNLAGAPGDFRAQAVQAFENLKLALAAVGADFSHVVKVTNLLADVKHLPIFREVRNQYLDISKPPASTTVQISAFAREGALLEIEASRWCRRKRQPHPLSSRTPRSGDPGPMNPSAGDDWAKAATSYSNQHRETWVPALASLGRDDGRNACEQEGAFFMTDIRYLSPDTMPKPRGYSQVVEAIGPGRIVFIAGQLGYTPDGKIASDFRGQAMQAFENFKAALASVGGDFSQVVKVTSYFVNMDDLPAYFEVRDRYVNTAAPPASTAVQIAKLARPEALFEIEAIAVLPAK